MRIAYITAGAAGMYCGSCLRDNTLAAALRNLGHDALLIPTYTPIRTDEVDVSQHRVFFGGINVYLQQKSWLFRHTPWLLDRLLDLTPLLRWVSRFAARTSYSDLGSLTISMLRGRDGRQRKEVLKLARWLAAEVKPDIVVLTNALLGGIVPTIRKDLGVPVLVTLQGDDIFLDALHDSDRKWCLELIRANDASVAGYLCTCRDYADFMSNYLGLSREKMHVVYPGLNLKGHGASAALTSERPLAVGYFARICPEKGFHLAVDAFIALRRMVDAPRCQFRASGWLGENQRHYFHEQLMKFKQAGLAEDFDYIDCPSHADKVRFLHSIDVLSVPTIYREPKGLYVLEAWANRIPVVQPAHGAFVELIELGGGGLLVPPNDPIALAAAWHQLLSDPDRRQRLGQAGEAAVRNRFHAEIMARETVAVLRKFVPDAPTVVS